MIKNRYFTTDKGPQVETSEYTKMPDDSTDVRSVSLDGQDGLWMVTSVLGIAVDFKGENSLTHDQIKNIDKLPLLPGYVEISKQEYESEKLKLDAVNEASKLV